MKRNGFQVLPYAKMLKQAPLAIVVCGETTWMNGAENTYWQQDCAAATQNILLAAEAIGLGAVWTGVYPNEQLYPKLHDYLGLPETVQPFIMNPTDFMDMMVGYYKQFVSPWMEIDADIMARLAEGDPDAYIDFFKDYQVKYAENVEKYFTVLGMGLNREANEDYMKVMNQWNKAMISMGELMAVITKTGQESFNQIAEKVQADLAEGKTITTFRDFYNVWYSVTEAAYEKLLATDEFAKVFDDFSDRYAQYMIAQNKVYERMLSFLPIPTNTDMKSLYRTVYDLRKDVRDLKKALEAKETKKGDK